MADRLDKRGRRIGRNWWREYIVQTLRDAEDAWQALRESGAPIHSGLVPGANHDTAYYQLSEREYRILNPRPTLKTLLVESAGMRRS